ncbi:MAG TPA: hypothetical protein VMY37_07685 [Thermoguttaceae bacterium]|nr:hypothetical protein [Thermoguttaceae bacterium]
MKAADWRDGLVRPEWTAMEARVVSTLAVFLFVASSGAVHAQAPADAPAAPPGETVELKSAADCFAYYDRRFAEAMAALPRREPWREEDRAEIARVTKQCLGIRDAWRPEIRTETVRVTEHEGFRIEHLRGTSWPGVICTAHLYVPNGAKDGAKDKTLPLVLLCCGHGRGCKLSPGYQAMARHLARCGMLVLVFDNIGQGEREPMGHANPVVPFACGTTVEGLIALEALSWLDWARDDPRVDVDHMAAIGNSGGGKLTILLAALCPELAAISSSGWPSTFEFVARKEKKLCHCTLLPGTVGRIEVWHLLGCFAPRPMLIFQGKLDCLFPEDLFHRVARQVRGCYAEVGAADRFEAVVVPGEHSWDDKRRELLGRWLSIVFELGPAPALPEKEDLLAIDDGCLDGWPDDAVDVDTLARRLTGVDAPSELKLWDVFRPPVDLANVEQVTPRGDTRQILAQFEAFLKADWPCACPAPRAAERIPPKTPEVNP